MIIQFDPTQSGRIINVGVASDPIDASLFGPDYIYLDDSQYAYLLAGWQNYSYQNGQVVSTPIVPTLSEAQAQQIAVLEKDMNVTLVGGFTAKTLVGGATSPHQYPTDANAQANFSGLVAAFTANPNKSSATIQTLDAGWINHTKAEFFGVYSDGDSWKEDQYAQLTDLIGQVQAATTVAAVQAIVWTEATY